MAVPEMYGDLLDGDDSLGFEYTEILGDDESGLTDPSFVPSSSGAFVGDEDLMGAFVKRRQNAAAQALMRKRVAAGALLRGVPPRQSRE